MAGVAISAAVVCGPAAAQASRKVATGPQAAPSPVDRKGLLIGARSWGYQLQNVDAGTLAKSPYDVLVIDIAGGEGRSLSARDVSQLKRRPDGGRRLVIAAMTIGEAEAHRFYWRKAWNRAPPPWMGPADCRHKGRYRVRHWAPEWQAILFGKPGSHLDRIIKAGFDGVHLDRVDSHVHWRNERWQSAADMVDLVARLSAWAKSRAPGFLVLPHNGEELLVDGRYRAAIDGIGKEDMLFGDAGDDVPNHPDRIKRAERNFAARGSEALPVLAVEHARKTDNIEAARRRHAELGFVSYFGPRSPAARASDGKPHQVGRDAEAVASSGLGDGCE